MANVMHVLKQVWGLVLSLDHLRAIFPLRGEIRVSLVWDFRGDR
jgi:hypothetical protein